jgi:hypothetical protein
MLVLLHPFSIPPAVSVLHVNESLETGTKPRFVVSKIFVEYKWPTNKNNGANMIQNQTFQSLAMTVNRTN